MNKKQVAKLAWHSIALMILTTIHHIYGAAIYNTPWRLHVLIFSIPVAVLTGILYWKLVKNDSKSKLLSWLFIVITLLVSMGMIGVVEGIYNHALKNILSFSKTSALTLEEMFPAPTYEMPNDLFFEVSGILQGFIVIPMGVQFAKLFRLSSKQNHQI